MLRDAPLVSEFLGLCLEEQTVVMGQDYEQERVLQAKKQRRSSFQNVVAWKLKMAIISVTILCVLPMGRAGGSVEAGGACTREGEGSCFNKALALKLKIGAVFAIFVSSLLGVTLPLVGRGRFLRPESKALFIAKAFGAGVILATGFIHMLPEAISKLESDCLPQHPWHKFPWGTFFSMFTILAMNLIEFVATSYYEAQALKRAKDNKKVVASEGPVPEPAVTPTVTAEDVEKNTPYQNVAIHGLSPLPPTPEESSSDGSTSWHGRGGHMHGVQIESEEDGTKKIRSIVVAQVLEFGIASHSILIGLAMGVSVSPCDIRPLLAALVFHQFFEGVALGGCITQAGFRNVSSFVMALVFASTTPLGIGLGLAISASYNEQSVTALLTEGILDAISAGILIYMALVNLIANEFFSSRLRSDKLLQGLSFTALFLGAACLSIIGIWA